MPHLVTWNMQGANHSTENKWNTGVLNFFNQGADVVCLQECGLPPFSANVVWQDILHPELTLHEWGTARTRKYILFYHWDMLGSRVNLAIVTKDIPLLPAIVVPSPFGMANRPAIGLMVGTIAYFTLHAISPGGADANALIADCFAASPGVTAFVAGDFNREPVMVPGTTLHSPHTFTHSISNPARTLDYCYSNLPGPGAGGTVLSGIMSDHYPVGFNV